jgi:hypothetical protein
VHLHGRERLDGRLALFGGVDQMTELCAHNGRIANQAVDDRLVDHSP